MTQTPPLRDIERILLDRVGKEVGRSGFTTKVDAQTFFRRMPFGGWFFHVSIIPHETDFDITVDVAIRVDSVEEMVNRSVKLLSRREKKGTATMGIELGNLVDGRPRRWTIDHSTDIAGIVREIARGLEQFLIPYLHRYSDLELMLECLAGNDRFAWVHSPGHAQRCKRSVALALVLGKETAGDIAGQCDQFLQERSDPGRSSFQGFVDSQFPDAEPAP